MSVCKDREKVILLQQHIDTSYVLPISNVTFSQSFEPDCCVCTQITSTWL